MKTYETDEHLGKTITIACTGADLVDIQELTGFQGKLKSLSNDAYLRLKSSILELGFSFPVAAWKYRNKIHILDAHQRVETLHRMRDEGYLIPKLPVIWVEAKDRKEAAKKLLAATSQYGKIEAVGLSNFMEDFKLELSDVTEMFRFPEINFGEFQTEFFPNVEVTENEEVGEPDVSHIPEAMYTRKIKAPVYEPRGENPKIAELYDTKKLLELMAKIETSSVDDSTKKFLKMAAYRHVVFDYEAIAEFYAHADKELQGLMEDSALVIIDFDKAIERGFVIMSKKIAETYVDAK